MSSSLQAMGRFIRAPAQPTTLTGQLWMFAVGGHESIEAVSIRDWIDETLVQA